VQHFIGTAQGHKSVKAAEPVSCSSESTMTDVVAPVQEFPWKKWNLLALVALLVVMAAVLHLMGRVWWCSCGQYNIWASDIWSKHNSQHVLDPYSFTHVLHGVMYYAILWPFRRWLPLSVRAYGAVVFAAGWEFLENSDMVIQRYRAATISLDYFGDSVINSMADVLCCAVGFTLTARIPAWAGWLFFFGVEAMLMLTIRDSLLINIIMLVMPLDSIKQWQMHHG
jgi:hypothetical protein